MTDFEQKNDPRKERFAEFLESLEPAKAHYRESGRQFLLGSATALHAFADFLDQLDADYPGARNIGSGVLILESLLQIAIHGIEPLQSPLRDSDAHIEALFNLRAVLQAEKERRSGSESEQSQAVEVLDAILQGINDEIERHLEEQAEKPSSTPETYEVQIG